MARQIARQRIDLRVILRAKRHSAEPDAVLREGGAGVAWVRVLEAWEAGFASVHSKSLIPGESFHAFVGTSP